MSALRYQILSQTWMLIPRWSRFMEYKIDYPFHTRFTEVKTNLMVAAAARLSASIHNQVHVPVVVSVKIQKQHPWHTGLVAQAVEPTVSGNFQVHPSCKPGFTCFFPVSCYRQAPGSYVISDARLNHFWALNLLDWPVGTRPGLARIS